MSLFSKVFNIKRGFMTVEIIIVVSIITVSVLAVMSVTQKSIYVSRQALHVSQASFLLEEGAEVVRVVRDNSWNNISTLNINTNYYPTFSGNAWVLSSTPTSIGIFNRTISIANVSRDNITKDISSIGTDDPGTKLVTATVSWVEGGVTLNKTLQFYLTNIF